MNFRLTVIVALLCVLEVYGWSYDPDEADGPDNWSDTYDTCDGDRQSPINIDTDDVSGDDDLDDFEFDGYSTTIGVTMILENDGHTAKLTLTGATMTLSGGDLPQDYTFEQLHFHWGSDATDGSEHTIDGEYYPLEMHMVHHASQYNSVGDAYQQDEGLAVLGFMFEISDDDNEDLSDIITALSSITATDATQAVTTFSIMSVIEDYTDRYYRYSGGLTTPSCDESVIWSVFEDPIPISSSQLAQFRTLQDADSNAVTYNYRPVQPRNGRSIKTYRKSGASQVTVSLALLLTALALVY